MKDKIFESWYKSIIGENKKRVKKQQKKYSYWGFSFNEPNSYVKGILAVHTPRIFIPPNTTLNTLKKMSSVNVKYKKRSRGRYDFYVKPKRGRFNIMIPHPVIIGKK